MHKETVIAIGVGLFLGLLVATGFYRFRQAIKPELPTKPSASITPAVSPGATVATLVTLSQPTDGLVTSVTSTQLTGTSKPNVTLVVFVNNADQIVPIASDGSFSQDLSLVAGPNIITLVALDESGKTESIERLVVADITDVDTATSTAALSVTPTKSQ